MAWYNTTMAFWHNISHLIAPLIGLVGETGHTKVMKVNDTKKSAWYRNIKHQEAFDNVKQNWTREVLVSYHQYGELFEIYTDAASQQLGVVITPNRRPLAFFSHKFNNAKQKYYVAEVEL